MTRLPAGDSDSVRRSAEGAGGTCRSAQDKGKRAEDEAERYLASRGYVIICRNFRCRRGEIDLVAQHSGTLVFIEVRYRRRLDAAAESVDRRKRLRLIAAARAYLARHPGSHPCRFDVVCVAGDKATGKAEISLLHNAFDLAD
jgi:putative endonuclease